MTLHAMPNFVEGKKSTRFFFIIDLKVVIYRNVW